jgi:high-affinity nickel-transport protein
MALTVGALHLLGIGLLVLILTTADGAVLRTGALTVGVALTAYLLGLRHAFDADHLAAIDNTTRRLTRGREAPVSVGLWFSLGHSSVVFALTAAIAFGVRGLAGQVQHAGSGLQTAGGWIGTLASGGFLYLIAALNIAILAGIAKTFVAMRAGEHDEAELERRLANRGLMNRLLSRVAGRVTRPAQMYPVGLLFGLGFDTATEIGLLVLAGGAVNAGLPWYGALCLPLIFAAGMSALDSLDGWLMGRAYGWAFEAPVRKVFYNLTVTGLSVAIALLIGTVELGGLVASKLALSGGFWSSLEHVDINALGFAIAALFIGVWLLALAIWRFGRIEERWQAGSGAGAKFASTPGGAPTAKRYAR